MFHFLASAKKAPIIVTVSERGQAKKATRRKKISKYLFDNFVEKL